MKIAALVDFPYWEAKVGTAIRYESLCQALSRVCDLTVISTVSLHNRYAGFAANAPYRLLDRQALKEVDAAIGHPEMPGVRPDRQMPVRTITHVVTSEGFDAVLTPYFNRLWMIERLPRHVARIIDTHDCQSQRTRSFAKHGLSPTFAMTPEEEGQRLADYDIALAMSDEDQEEFRAMTDIPVVTAPFRLPARDLAPLREVYRTNDHEKNLMFIAAKSDVNDMTLDFLLRQVMPLVPMHTTLHVVGNVTMPEITLPNTTVVRHEGVEDLVPIYGRMDLALNPTFAGGGVKTKTLEAISYGVPILTSDEGARGMRHLLPDALVANDKETFAWRIVQLLEDPEERHRLSREMLARLRAEDSLSWVDPFRHILASVVEAKRGGRAA